MIHFARQRTGIGFFCHCLRFCLPCFFAFCLVLSGNAIQTFAARTEIGEKTQFSLDFSMIRLGSGPQVALVIAGIQGDEPGAFSAATLLATRYEIHKGAVWVVPNLNFPSIIKRSRGLHGDMNRKFARIDSKDPEFPTVNRIQNIIRHDDVKLVLNMHDGSGYYRPIRIDSLRNPSRWGQSLIIDQEMLDEGIFMHALGREASQVANTVNSCLIKPLHALHVHNTRTAEGDREMEKSLSYYAVRHGKAAFGLEASKEFPVAIRAYYHLHMVEAFLRQAGIEFSRDFELTPKSVESALQANLGVAFAENRIFLPLEDIRPAISRLPLPRESVARAVTSKPIMAVLPCPDKNPGICIHYGNRTITRIMPDWHEMDLGIDHVTVSVDGEEKTAFFGNIITVRKQFRIHPTAGYRVNAIGFDSGKQDEAGILIGKSNFEKRFSIDRQGSIFRIEVYRNKNLAGMFLVRFAQNQPALAQKNAPLPDAPGRESLLGF